MMVEDDANEEQYGLMPTSPKKQKMTIALNSPRSLNMQQASMLYLPATKALEYAEMGSEDKLLGAMSDSSPVLPLFHKTMINRSSLADGNSLIQAASRLSLTPSKRRAPDNDDSAARYNLSNISLAVLDLVVVGLDEDFPLIEWNNDHEEAGMHTLSQSSFSPLLSPSFGHNEHNSHHRLLRSKSFGSKLVALETLQTPISY
jgi:hypothetical protein